MLRNEPETIIADRISSGDRAEYFFKTFGAAAILCIEMELQIGNDTEHWDAMAQAITECNGMPYTPRQHSFCADL